MLKLEFSYVIQWQKIGNFKLITASCPRNSRCRLVTFNTNFLNNPLSSGGEYGNEFEKSHDSPIWRDS